MMQNDPEAALSLLNGVDVSEFQDSATVARWAMLYSEAMVINKLSAPTDTIVNIAIDYYGRHNLADEFNKASQLKAMIELNDVADELATARYLQKEREFLLYKERVKREQLLILCIAILLIALGGILWMRQRMRFQSLQNETLMAEVSGLKSMIDSSRGDVGRLEAKLHTLLDDRFSLIDDLCQTYYETQGTKAERKAIVDKVKSEIDALRADSITKLEQSVNDCRDNLLVKVREQFPAIRPDDYQLLIYLASGLSTRTISLLLGESVDVVYKRKSRLKAKIKDVTGQLSSDVMSVF